eukprot:3617904-Rhodomonas_salina.2
MRRKKKRGKGRGGGGSGGHVGLEVCDAAQALLASLLQKRPDPCPTRARASESESETLVRRRYALLLTLIPDTALW